MPTYDGEGAEGALVNRALLDFHRRLSNFPLVAIADNQRSCYDINQSTIRVGTAAVPS
jgi:hypothetical protein